MQLYYIGIKDKVLPQFIAINYPQYTFPCVEIPQLYDMYLCACK